MSIKAASITAQRQAGNQASVADTARVLLTVLTPTVARGVLIRRRPVVRLLARVDADARAVRLLARLRDRYGDRPLLVRVGRRRLALVLSGDDARAVLSDTETFVPASREKRAALRHFQPHGVLATAGSARGPRRLFNEAVLDNHQPVHSMGARFATVIAEELASLPPQLGWKEFSPAWWRITRRIVLGDAARDDHAITGELARLRRDANWAFAKSRRDRRRWRFHAMLRAYLDAAGPGSLAERASRIPEPAATDQFGQWLFAFDAAGIAAFQALALLLNHQEELRAATQQAAGFDPARPSELPYLRACALEAVRLWPTTPAILRDSTAGTSFQGATVPAGTAFLIFTPFLHRDGDALAYADRFTPRVWLDGRAAGNPSVLPFSGGSGRCPGRELVLLATSAALATMLNSYEMACDGTTGGTAQLRAERPVPGTLDPFALRFILMAKR